MSTADELVDCPGCKNKVHQRAEQCPKCGYRSELSGFGDLLGSLSTVGSILVGFTLAALVTLATDDSHAMDDPVVPWAAGCWLFAALLLLLVMVLSEFSRREDVGPRIAAAKPEVDQFWKRCVLLLILFTVALMGSAAGIVLIAFHFTILHGFGAVVMVAVCLILAWWRFG